MLIFVIFIYVILINKKIEEDKMKYITENLKNHHKKCQKTSWKSIKLHQNNQRL